MVARLAIVLGVLIASTAVVATSAQAVNDGDVTTLRSWTQGMCLDTNSFDVYNHVCVHNDVNQLWKFEFYGWWEVYGEGFLKIMRVRSVAFNGRCLDSDYNGHVYVNPCQDPNYWQKWIVNDFIDVQNHRVLNLEDRNTHYCLDSNLPWLNPYTRNGCYSGGYQDWVFGYRP